MYAQMHVGRTWWRFSSQPLHKTGLKSWVASILKPRGSIGNSIVDMSDDECSFTWSCYCGALGIEVPGPSFQDLLSPARSFYLAVQIFVLGFDILSNSTDIADFFLFWN